MTIVELILRAKNAIQTEITRSSKDHQPYSHKRAMQNLLPGCDLDNTRKQITQWGNNAILTDT